MVWLKFGFFNFDCLLHDFIYGSAVILNCVKVTFDRGPTFFENE